MEEVERTLKQKPATAEPEATRTPAEIPVAATAAEAPGTNGEVTGTTADVAGATKGATVEAAGVAGEVTRAAEEATAAGATGAPWGSGARGTAPQTEWRGYKL